MVWLFNLRSNSLKLSMPLFEWLKSNDGLELIKILGTSPISIDLAEDREEFTKILEELNISNL